MVVDASQPPDEVFENVRAAIARVLKDRDVSGREDGWAGT